MVSIRFGVRVRVRFMVWVIYFIYLTTLKYT